MESFSSLVKAYLYEKTYEELGIGERERVKWKPCCARAFLRAVFLFLSVEENGITRITTKNQDLLEITAYLLLREYDPSLSLSVQKIPRKGSALVLPQNTRRQLLSDTEEMEYCSRCRILLVRGAFLSCGTVTDPKKGYHASFRVPDPRAREELREILLSFGLETKEQNLKGDTSLYLKESGKIEDLLSLTGAERFSLQMMDQKIEKSIRGDINRRQNFDDANLKKTVNGAQSVISAIRYLEENDLLETLPEPLQSAAKLRMSYPEISLKELCQRSEEELTKSGLNHRLQKLVHYASKAKREGEKK